MKIKTIILNNLGPYIGLNTFDFDNNDSNKNIYIIGGKNGAGKTTLFTSIKLCIYGNRAFGFAAVHQKYLAKVSKLINNNVKFKENSKASVSMDIIMDDGMNDDLYTIERIWNIHSNKITEELKIYKNYAILSKQDKSDFESYLLQILPLDLFKFYFFDGEKISDFIFNGSKNTDFKDAFLKLCGLDTIQIIYDNFLRISKQKIKPSDAIAEEYHSFIKKRNELEDEISKLEEEIKLTQSLKIKTEEDLSILEKKYAKNGGISKKDWFALNDQLIKEEAHREQMRRWLKETANNTLPFIIIKEQLMKLKERLEYEERLQSKIDFYKNIDAPEVYNMLKNIFSQSEISNYDHLSDKIIKGLKSLYQNETSEELLLMLSQQEQFEVRNKINTVLDFDISSIKSATDSIADSLNKVDVIRSKLNRSSIFNYEDYSTKKEELRDKLNQLNSNILEKEKQTFELTEQLGTVEKSYQKVRINYRAVLKEKSINDLSSNAMLAFEDLKQILYKKFVMEVESNFKEIFAQLINKRDLIDGIHIDENLNVYPYKIKRFTVAEIVEMKQNHNDSYIKEQFGNYAYEILQNTLFFDSDIELPVEVKQQLSAGEKQIFIMSLYQSLSKLNKVSVPYIIDTPFARIDKGHRSNILKNFFMKLGGQVIILSTDEEINHQCLNDLAASLANTYLLDHIEGGNTKVLPNQYFGGDRIDL